MRRTRMERNRTLRNVASFLLIAAVLVGSGYLIGRFLLAGLFNNKSDQGEPVSSNTGGSLVSETVTVQVEVKPMTLYRVQVGAYANKENADKTAQEVLQKGVPAAVMSPDPLYKVYCGVAGSKDAANKISESILPKLSGSIIEKDQKPYIGSYTIDQKTITITGEKTQVDAIQQALVKAQNALEMLVTYWDNYYLGKEQKVNIKDMANDISSTRQQLAQITPSTQLKPVYDMASTILGELETSIKSAQDAQGGDGGKVASGVTALIKCVDVFSQELKKAG